MRDFRRHGTVLLTGASLALAGAACAGDDSVAGPGTQFDAPVTAQSVTGIRDAAAANPALIQLGFAGQALGEQLAANASLAPIVERFNLLGDAPLYRIVAARAGQPPIFPANFLAKTFVWDPDAGKYVIDEERAGAPSNGVRFILYRLHAETQIPDLPLVEVGYLDLIDESSPSSTRLRIVAVDSSGASDVTLLDYFLDGSYTLSGESFALAFVSAGFLSDGVDRIDFSLDQSLAASAGFQTVQLSVLHQISAPTLGASLTLSMEGEVSATDDEGDLRVVLTVQDGSDAAVLDVRVIDRAVDGELRYNGQTVILIGGDTENPVFTGPDGGAPGQEELEALAEIWGAIGELLEFAEALFEPLAALFGVEDSF